MCVLGVFSGCENGCEKSKPEQIGVLKPVQGENAEKGIRADLPVGIENPAVPSGKPSDPTERASAAHGSDKTAVQEPTRTEALSNLNVNHKTVAKVTKHAGKPRTTASSAKASVSTPPAPVATPVAPVVRAEPETKAPTHVVVPNTRNVRAEVPAGLQRLLDDDPRMQPWVNKVMQVAEQCYAKERGYNPLAKGVITANLTLHQNERPDASMGSLPPMLAGVVACATGKLTATRMPFFTGDEGAKYTVRFHFTR